MTQLDRLINVLYKVILGILIVLGCVMLVVAWMHVFYRYILNDSLTWSEELLKILLVWFCLLSTSIISVQREHVSIVVFKQMMPDSINKLLTSLAQILMFVAAVIVLYVGVDFVMAAGIRETPAMRIPYRYAYAAIPVAFSIVALYELRNCMADFIKGPKLAVQPQPKE